MFDTSINLTLQRNDMTCNNSFKSLNTVKSRSLVCVPAPHLPALASAGLERRLGLFFQGKNQKEKVSRIISSSLEFFLLIHS